MDKVTYGLFRVYVSEGCYSIEDLEELLQQAKALKEQTNKALENSIKFLGDDGDKEA